MAFRISATQRADSSVAVPHKTAFLVRAAVLLMLTGIMSTLVVATPVVGSEPASVAMAGTYPYPNAPDCDEYGPTGCVADKWSFYQGQCTSWVAFRLNDRNGIAFNNTYRQPPGYRWSNASNWVNAANRAGIAVNGTPGNGSVAWYSGHVAYVEAVNADGSILISEMNYDLHNGFRQRKLYPGQSGWPAKFIHVKDIASSTPRPTLKAVSVTIDEPTRYGPTQWLRRRSGHSYDGYGWDSWTTTTIQSSRSRDVNFFRWQYKVRSGYGGSTKVRVFIPRRWGYARAHYKIYLNGSYVRTVSITQKNYTHRWVTLRTLNLKPGDVVRVQLGDRSNSAYGTQLVADAMRLTPAG